MTAHAGTRPGKGVEVINDLGVLNGPTYGIVTLPHHLMWQPAHARTFDLDDPATLRWLYEIVLREARGSADLVAWLDGETLQSLWPSLYLPHAVRHVWEVRHPTLSAAREASPDQANPTYSRWLARRQAA